MCSWEHVKPWELSKLRYTVCSMWAGKHALKMYTMKCKLWLKCMFYSETSRAQYLCMAFPFIITSLGIRSLSYFWCIVIWTRMMNLTGIKTVAFQHFVFEPWLKWGKEGSAKRSDRRSDRGQQSQPILCLTESFNPHPQHFVHVKN